MDNPYEGFDLVALNGKIVTMDRVMSTVEAIAISNGQVKALGSTAEIKSYIRPNVRVLNLEGRTVLPGFIDSHQHLEIASYALGLMAQCHTPPNNSIDDVIRRLSEWVLKAPPGEWVIGQGCLLQERRLKEKRFPDRYDLDKVSRERPVVLRFGMHITILNSKALSLLGIHKGYVAPGGSIVDFDSSTKEPTGVTRDFWNYIPVPEINEERLTRAIEDNIQQFSSANGVTSIHDLPETARSLKIYQKLLARQSLNIRIRFYYEVPNMIKIEEIIASGLEKGFGNEFLRLGGIKIFVDGGISAANAYFHEPYQFDKTNYGKLAVDQETLNSYVEKGHKAGLQILMHAAGDKATDMVLEAMRKAQAAYFLPDHRHRIEHFGNLYPKIHRFTQAKRLGILAVPNMGFISSFGDQIEYLLGEERARSSFWGKTLIDEGFKVPGSSDHTGTHPENSNPFFCMSCAINRKSFFGKVISPEEKISLTEAIKMYTNYSAYAGFEENEKGSLEVGKLGDLIVVSENPWEVSDSEIANIKVICTIVGGKVIYNPSGL